MITDHGTIFVKTTLDIFEVSCVIGIGGAGGGRVLAINNLRSMQSTHGSGELSGEPVEREGAPPIPRGLASLA